MRAAREVGRRGAWPDRESAPSNIEKLIEMAGKGDRIARSIFRRAGEMLGLGVAGLIQVFNPARVVVTGEYTRIGSILFGPMSETMADNLNREFLTPDLVIIENWEDTDWARGAACLALQGIYRKPGGLPPLEEDSNE